MRIRSRRLLIKLSELDEPVPFPSLTSSEAAGAAAPLPSHPAGTSLVLVQAGGKCREAREEQPRGQLCSICSLASGRGQFQAAFQHAGACACLPEEGGPLSTKSNVFV